MTSPIAQRPGIGFLTGTLNAMAGAERMTATIANALAARGYRVSILSLWDRDSCFALHPDVRHEALFEERPSFKSAYLATVAGIRRHAKQQDLDTLVLVDTMLTLFTVPALVGLAVRQIAWEHCHFDQDLGRRSRRLARRLAACCCEDIVVLTYRDRTRWTKALRPRGHVTCLPNPLPFHLPAEPAPRSGRTVLAVGRLTHAKGFDLLLEAWAMVNAVVTGWELRIVGEGEERQALEALRHRLGLDNCVSLPGLCYDITEAYQLASVFCLSSRYEGFGLVLIEAMAFGLPIVSTDCEAGPRELLEDHRNACVVAAEDPIALSRALIRVMQDHDTAQRLSLAGRETAQHYAPEHIFQRWDQLLNG